MSTPVCKHCGSELLIKKTKSTSAQAKKVYYYSHYYVCPSCKRLYHDERFKVTNPQTQAISFDSPNEKNGSKNIVNDYIEIWTDGACIYNGTPQAKAAWAFVAGDVEQSGTVEGNQTNNRGEGLAIYHALFWAGEAGYKRIVLHTDSQVSLFSVQKFPEKVVANRDIFIGIASVVAKYGLQVQYKKVLGHSGIEQNERVDKLANTTAQQLL